MGVRLQVLTPYPHQERGAEFHSKNRRVLNRSEAGTGKTGTALLGLLKTGVDRAVVVCPPCVLHNWVAEIALWLPDWTARIQKTAKPVPPPGPKEIVVTGYSRAVIERGKLGVLILDEAHQVKNEKTIRHQRVAALAARVSYIWALTATPITKDPYDLWNILTILGLERAAYGTRWRMSKFFGAIENKGQRPTWGKITPQAWQPLMKNMFRVTQADLKDLPGRRTQDVYIELTSGQNKDCDALAAEIPPPEEWKDSDVHLFAALSKYARVKAAGIPKLFDQLGIEPTCEDPVVVFSAFKEAGRAIADHYGWPFLSGETSAEERTKIVADFQAGKYKGVVATIAACGVGITLTRSRTLFFVSQTFSHAMNSQAADRVYRISQERQVSMYIVKTPHRLDRMIDTATRRKAQYQ